MNTRLLWPLSLGLVLGFLAGVISLRQGWGFLIFLVLGVVFAWSSGWAACSHQAERRSVAKARHPAGSALPEPRPAHLIRDGDVWRTAGRWN